MKKFEVANHAPSYLPEGEWDLVWSGHIHFPFVEIEDGWHTDALQTKTRQPVKQEMPIIGTEDLLNSLAERFYPMSL